MKHAVCLGSFLAIFSITSEASPAASLPEAWRNWRYLRPLSFEETVEPRLSQVSLPMEVFGRAQKTLADLRVIDEDFREVPYVLYFQRHRKTQNWLSGRMSEVSFVPGEYTHLVFDTGTDPSLHNRLEIQLEEKDFFARAELAVSDDRKSWRLVREKAPIYRFESEGTEVSEISYAETRARWLRLRILYGDRQLRVENCRVSREIVDEAELTPLPFRMTPRGPDPDSAGRESIWQVDLEVELVPVSAVHFEAEQSEFHRPIRISWSPDGNVWHEAGRGTIYRYSESGTGGNGEEQEYSSRSLEFPERRGRHWRVSVRDGNDVPVDGLLPTLQTTPRKVVIRQNPGARYHLLYGNNRVDPPRYDLGQLTSRKEMESAPYGTLEEEEINPGYVSPEPWTERHPVVLWVALVVAVAVLGAIALRSLR